ncbi:hypothetical protein EDB85DRAFT_1885377 [Lactarius pseudohatsudake]|nr:hypothetical protein EDB85DRAFT_1885377 [Lactarius pseudohatsudake]
MARTNIWRGIRTRRMSRLRFTVKHLSRSTHPFPDPSAITYARLPHPLLFPSSTIRSQQWVRSESHSGGCGALPPWFPIYGQLIIAILRRRDPSIHIWCYHAARNRSAPAVQQENIPMFGECRSNHLQRGNMMDIVVGPMRLFEREGIQYPRHLCGNNLDPMHIYNHNYTYTSIWVAPLSDDLFPYGLGSISRVNRLHDHVNVPRPAASPPNREKPGIHGHFYAKDGNGYATPPFFYIPPSGEESRPEKTIRAHGSSSLLAINLQRSRTPRCHRTPCGYFPDVSLLRGGGGEKGLRGSHRPPASESAGKSERTHQSGAAAAADTMGAYYFWRYAKMTLTVNDNLCEREKNTGAKGWSLSGEAVGDETTSGKVGPEHMEGGGAVRQLDLSQVAMRAAVLLLAHSGTEMYRLWPLFRDSRESRFSREELPNLNGHVCKRVSCLRAANEQWRRSYLEVEEREGHASAVERRTRTSPNATAQPQQEPAHRPIGSLASSGLRRQDSVAPDSPTWYHMRGGACAFGDCPPPRRCSTVRSRELQKEKEKEWLRPETDKDGDRWPPDPSWNHVSPHPMNMLLQMSGAIHKRSVRPTKCPALRLNVTDRIELARGPTQGILSCPRATDRGRLR